MLVSPSILAADFLRLGEEIDMLNRSEADMIHCDVMDGEFVPNISFGFPVLEAVGRAAQKPMDVHMMIENPWRFINQVRDTGAALMNVHQEACEHLDRTIHEIHAAGMKAGVTLNPATPVAMLEDVIGEVELVLLMSVNPGFGGQPFIDNTLRKVARLRRLIAESGSKALIELDGGINGQTAPRCAAAGVDVLVTGSYVFHAPDPLAAIAALRELS